MAAIISTSVKAPDRSEEAIILLVEGAAATVDMDNCAHATAAFFGWFVVLDCCFNSSVSLLAAVTAIGRCERENDAMVRDLVAMVRSDFGENP